MKALILAAGYAVRLYPLTKQYPKPLLKVGKSPIIDYIVAKLELIDQVDEIIVVTNSKFFSKFKKWAGHLNCAKRISLIDDLSSSPENRRGAVGDIVFSINKKKIKDDLLVIGGDNLFDYDLSGFMSFVKDNSKTNVIGVYDIKDLSQASKYGVIKLNRKNKVVDFREKPESPDSTLVAMCLYYFPKGKLKLFGRFFKEEKHKTDATGFYIDWLRKENPVLGFVFKGKWFDIGDKKFYEKANKTFN